MQTFKARFIRIPQSLSLSRSCPFCKIVMDDLVSVNDVKEGYWMQLGGYDWNKDPNIHTRFYRHYECPKCGLFLLYRTGIT